MSQLERSLTNLATHLETSAAELDTAKDVTDDNEFLLRCEGQADGFRSAASKLREVLRNPAIIW